VGLAVRHLVQRYRPVRLEWRSTVARVTDLDDFAQICSADHGLVVLSTTRPDGSTQASVVNAGVTANPLTGAASLALVAAGGTRKLANLRRRPRATAVAKSGWQWVAVEGATTIIGPDDLPAGFAATDLPALLRAIFVAAGGNHDDWDEYDRVMAAERRAAVFIAPERVYSNG
jgi:PPOX class probable F420-dependent enzyme